MVEQRTVSESLEADVAIVGAGLAGLVAARRIAAAGKRPVVVEARDRVGGRLLNEEIGEGKVVEVGGQWIGPTQERIAALAGELGVETFPTYDEGRHLIEIAGKLTSYSGPLTDASPRRSVPSTGPAPRRQPSGTATWTAPCSPASAPPTRCWPQSAPDRRSGALCVAIGHIRRTGRG
ncbi:MAG TPA: FAD-dependent oxidoreductase [Solirubrobacterales bacterium]|nr:FAD-dependent oxidoreductase [Solirubrobacterales bacterium]